MPRAKESTAGASTAQAQQDAVSEGIDNFELPRSLIMKLARASQVPETTKFSKDSMLSILKCSTVWVNYLAATAHEVASSKQHKSISATDVVKALELVEFPDIAKVVQAELPTYRETQRADKRKGGAKAKAKDTSESASAASKPRGKGKAAAASEPQQPIPPIHIRPSSSASAAHTAADPSSEVAEDVDEDQEMQDPDQDQEEEAVEDVDEEMDDEELGDEEEPEDTMALEDEELRRDAKGLDAQHALEED
ncbi:histone-fold-containing protein [Dichomitus squalens LYAD-421 SS1]|uniref:DNA polymerase epsilon subunit D n=1 Tax=Dichomitus squalens (strain LYAD-421) TaxID=732165 RepID=R7T0V6_DICSQ|nr:histone-fold-containing protein [Dichomitus squalens LYAD-421 SS1]EJF61986.1 histone-fold-containing protein [Dichomitus squalens LYAD-421 SS1]